jgi:integration host factor subunit beta
MVRSELSAKLLATHPKLTPRDAEIIVATIFGEIAAALSRDDRVELRGFGVFSARQRDARVGRNPNGGAKVSVPAKRIPHFKIGAAMSIRLNGGAESDQGDKRRGLRSRKGEVENEPRVRFG